MLRRLRIAMGQRDSRYRLTDLIEVDDAYLGANKIKYRPMNLVNPALFRTQLGTFKGYLKTNPLI